MTTTYETGYDEMAEQLGAESSGFIYEDVDPEDRPKRTRAPGAGRQVTNPHKAVVDSIKGTGQCKAFTVEDPRDEDERRKLIQRNVRYLRMAAHNNERSLRIWTEEVDGGRLRINFQDTPWHRRGGKSEEDDDASL